MKTTKEEIDKVVDKNANENGFFGIENKDRRENINSLMEKGLDEKLL